jgi:DNA-binding NarL/FixJ family response regulator
VSPILSPAASASPSADRARITALIADDEPHVRAYLRLVLRSLGVVTVWEAGDGVEALRIYEEQVPTFVLLDVNMPMLTGEGVIHALAQRFPEAAVVIVTSQSEHETVKRFAGLGAIGYVLKQQPREVMTGMIAEALDLLDLDSTE